MAREFPLCVAVIFLVYALCTLASNGKTQTTLTCNVDIRLDSFGNDAKPGTCYLLNWEDRGTFSQARSFCKGLNDSVKWDVADIEDQQEKDFIYQVITDKIKYDTAFWIGLNNIGTDGKWTYLNNVSNSLETVYKNWAANMPTTFNVDQDCVTFHEKDGTFQDKTCYTDRNKYMCKVNMSGSNASCSSVDPNFDTFGNPDKLGVCYLQAVNQEGHFDEARRFCKGLSDTIGWDVADIQDEQEQNFLISRSTNINNVFWIGLNDRATEGKWQYLHGIHDIDNVYNNWRRDQPNGKDINCVIYNETGTFQNKACDTESYGYMCKARITPDEYLHPLPTSSEMTEQNALECPASTPLTYHGCTTFIFLSGNAGCINSSIIQHFFAPDVTRCARMCMYLYPGICRSFSFLATGDKDACELCKAGRITEQVELSTRSNRVYYYLQ